jgi:hypothetical protein
VIPANFGAFKGDEAENHKHNKSDYFLHNFELNERERSSVPLKTDAIGWYLATVFKESDYPREQNHGIERPISRYAC